MKKIEYYRKLMGVTSIADLKALKGAYRNLMKDCHPDKFQDDAAALAEAEKKSKKIIEAYHFLVSIAPETIEAGMEQYMKTINEANLVDFVYKDETLRFDFSDGNSYEYFSVPKNTYTKLVNAPSVMRFARRHICTSFTYRSVNKLVTT